MVGAQEENRMKLYDYAHAPNPKRVHIFLAEKGLDMERVPIDLTKGEQLSEEYMGINPLCQVPVLELDDGTRISECLAICHYLEEIKPQPNLFGSNPAERAQVLMWNHIVEQEGIPGLAEALRNRIKMFKDHALPGPVGYAQIPELVERGRKRSMHFLDFMDRRLGGQDYLALDRFTVADITLRAAVDMAARMASRFDFEVLDGRNALAAWHSRLSERPGIANAA